MYIFQMVWLMVGIVLLSAGLTLLEGLWRAVTQRSLLVRSDGVTGT